MLVFTCYLLLLCCVVWVLACSLAADCRLLRYPELRSTFYIAEGSPASQTWRLPQVNETCCARPALAALLDAVAVAGPSALDAHAEVSKCQTWHL